MKTLWLAGLVAGLLVGGAQAAEVKAGALTLHDAVVRASLGQNPNTAAYLTITNGGDRADQLLSVTCACAAKVEAHASMNHGGMMSMKAAGPVAIPGHGAVSFAPGGLHLMLTGLKSPLTDGRTQEMTLRFEHAGAIKVPFRVQARIGG